MSASTFACRPASATRSFAAFHRWIVFCLIAIGSSSCASQLPIQWDSREQIWLSERSQVRLRAAQSRVFDTTDRTRILEAVVSTFQDLDFQVQVLDEELGVVSGKKFLDLSGTNAGHDPFYHLYDDESLLVFIKTYRTWGPFQHRLDMMRITVTVRVRNESQLIVRAAAQYHLQALENPETYQIFFRSLEQALFMESELL